jgi:RNA polymerase sigma factor (sigma-70 family)
VVASLTDETLLAGLGSGDPDAAASFVSRYQRRVFGLTRSILRDDAAAEEAAQETFVRAWRHADAYDPRRGSVPAWLLTIARNVSLTMLVPERRHDPIDPELLAAIESREPDDHEERIADAAMLRAAMAALPEEQRRALLLAAFYGFSAREVSELDEIPLGTAKTRIRTAMLRLRSALEMDDDG